MLGNGAEVFLAPSAAVGWQRMLHPGGSTMAAQLLMFDLAAPFAFVPGRDAQAAFWPALCAPGAQAVWSPSPGSMGVSVGARLLPVAAPDGSVDLGVRLGMGVSRAVPLQR